MIPALRAARALLIVIFGAPAFIAGWTFAAVFALPFSAGREAFDNMAADTLARQREKGK